MRFFRVNFLRLFAKKIFFLQLIDHRLVRIGIAEAKESGGTAVNKNRGLIFFEQCHQCSCPPLWRVATLFFILFNLSRLNVIRVAIQSES